EIALEGPQLLGQQRLFRGQAPLEPCDPETTMQDIQVLVLEVTELRDAQAMIEGEQEHGRIAPVVARAAGALEEDAKFGLGEIVPHALVGIDGSLRQHTLHTTPSALHHGRRLLSGGIPCRYIARWTSV